MLSRHSLILSDHAALDSLMISSRVRLCQSISAGLRRRARPAHGGEARGHRRIRRISASALHEPRSSSAQADSLGCRENDAVPEMALPMRE